MKTVHYLQMALAGLIQAALVMAVAMPYYSHYIMIATVCMVALLSPLGLASPAMLQPNPAFVAAMAAPVMQTNEAMAPAPMVKS